ncbi:MAG TPA: HAD family hydrolase, partial [Actinocrinis sp.]
MFTVLWCYLRNVEFTKDAVDYSVSADLTGQANHLGVTIEADIVKQKQPQTNGGYLALGFGKTDPLLYSRLTTDHPIDLTRWQVANCYMGRAALINSGGASAGQADLAALQQRGPDGAAAAAAWVAHTKGAPEVVLERCTAVLDAGVRRGLTGGDRAEAARVVDRWARQGLRVLAIAHRPADSGEQVPHERETVERDLCLLGLVALLDPPRPHVTSAIERAHDAGIRVHVVTGDNGLTAAEIARRVGIGGDRPRVVSDGALEAMSEAELDELLTSPRELVFARSAPEAKLRIADALRDLGEVVAMTGDGV